MPSARLLAKEDFHHDNLTDVLDVDGAECGWIRHRAIGTRRGLYTVYALSAAARSARLLSEALLRLHPAPGFIPARQIAVLLERAWMMAC